MSDPSRVNAVRSPRFVAALALVVGSATIGSTIGAELPATTATPPNAEIVTVSGGEAAISFNPDALAAADLRIDDLRASVAHSSGVAGVRFDVSRFRAVAAGGLQVIRQGAAVIGVGGGTLRFDGGFALVHASATVDLHGFVLRSDPDTRFGLLVDDARGVTWLTADHAHYAFSDDAAPTFSMQHMNLRISKHLAEFAGDPRLAGTLIGGIEFSASAPASTAAPESARHACSAPWPRDGLVTDIKLVLGRLSGFWDSVYAPRCGLPPLPNGGACTATSRNGKLVIGGDASLRNVGDTGVAWYRHFGGDHPPYGNDQHPFLVWNLYRIDGEGRIRQIGVSAVKHAFYSVNQTCGCVGGNVVWPGCEDVYSFSSNDNGSSTDTAGARTEQNLAPRSEIIPQRAIWARCGSLWDRDCDGAMDAGSGAQDLYQLRMLVDESDLLPPAATGARYFFESWYVVRDATNFYDGMGYREIAPRKTGANWSVALVGANEPERDFFSGPALDRWVAADAATTTAMNRELVTPLGRARVAFKATPLAGGRWRYEYAVMNFDYAHARIDPAHAIEPNLKLLSNHGFSAFGVDVPRGVATADLRFDDVDGDTGNDWVAERSDGAITWTAPPSGNTLDWGTLYHFEFTAPRAPSAARRLHIVGAATADEKEIDYTLAMPGP